MKAMKEERTFVKCEHCGADVRDINLQSHLYRVHAVGEAPKETKNEEEPHESVKKRRRTRKEEGMRYWFICSECDRKSLLPTGTIRLVYRHKKDNIPQFLYHLEVRCKHCGSPQVGMEQMDKFGVILRTAHTIQLSDENVEVSIGGKTFVDEKEMRHEEAISYLESRLSADQGNWELWLRYGNTLGSMRNDYEKAIGAWKKAAELNPKAIAPYARLGETFFNRWKTYNEKGARGEAVKYLSHALKAIQQKGDAATIHHELDILASCMAGMIREAGFGDSGIYVASMKEVEKPLAEHTYRQEKNERPIVRMSGSEKAAGLVENAVVGLLHENPDITREKLITELKGLSKNFDGKKTKEGERLRQLIKLYLIHEREKGKKLYTEAEIFLGIIFIADTLKDSRYLEMLKTDSRKAGVL